MIHYTTIHFEGLAMPCNYLLYLWELGTTQLISTYFLFDF